MIGLKSFLQTFKIQVELLIAKSRATKINNVNAVHTSLSKRNFKWNNNSLKVFAIFHINNWETVLLEELQRIGSTHHFTWDGPSNFFNNRNEWQSYYNDINARLITEFDKFYCDTSSILIFIYASDFSISPESIEYLKRKNTLVISFCWDDLLYYSGITKRQPVGVKQLSQSVDFNLTMSPEALPRYAATNSACFFWKSSAISKECKPLSSSNLDQKDNFYVLFIGSKYGWRESFINTIKKSGIKVICFGKGWGSEPLSNENMVKEIKKAPVTLGFSNVGYTNCITTIKGRDFEVPTWGGLYLTQYSPGLDFYYEDGKDILTYKTIQDCLDKICFIKENPKEALQIRQSGYKKANMYSTWPSRFNYLTDLINKITHN